MHAGPTDIAIAITPKVTFQWNDEFRIAATNERFENGGTSYFHVLFAI